MIFERKENIYSLQGVGRAGAPETGAEAPAAYVAVTEYVAWVGIPELML